MKIFAPYHAVSFSLFISAILFCLNANAQPGFLDTSFADKGILISENFTGICYTVAIQKDGKIIAAGSDISFPERYLVVRYNIDGSLDYSFGDSGRVYTSLPARSRIMSLSVLEDGKILASGNCNNFTDIGLVRYLPDGNIDSSFGENGIVISDLGEHEYFGYMALQSDGKIVATGGYSSGGDNDDRRIFIERFLPDGTLDESFGNKGSTIIRFTTMMKVTCIAMQKDDKILVAGTRDYVTDHSYFQVSRYMPDGMPDNSFGKESIAKGYFAGYYSDLYAIALQQDGKIVTAGDFSSSEIGGFGLVRFENNGTIDNSFGTEGLVVTKFDSSGSSAKTLQIQEDGKIIAAGSRYHWLALYYQFALARYNTNGSLDSTFGNNGQQITEPLPYYIAYTSALQKDGKIVLGGNGGSYFVLARYIGGDGVLPVKYASITAKQNKNTVVLNWQTTNENNNAFFAIEHAANNKDFTEISKVNSEGSSSIMQQYSYTDKQPAAGNNYYRLKQVNTNGQYSYSKTVAVNFIPAGIITLHPNPANDIITIDGMNSESTSTISLFDMQGKMMLRKNIKAAAYNISVSSFAPGIYIVKVQDGNNITVLKFEKK